MAVARPGPGLTNEWLTSVGISTPYPAGMLLRRLQRGESIGLPHSRPMPSIGRRCHELRIVDEDATWRIVYHFDEDAIVILEVISKKTQATPKQVIRVSKRRLGLYLAPVKEEE